MEHRKGNNTCPDGTQKRVKATSIRQFVKRTFITAGTSYFHQPRHTLLAETGVKQRAERPLSKRFQTPKHRRFQVHQGGGRGHAAALDTAKQCRAGSAVFVHDVTPKQFALVLVNALQPPTFPVLKRGLFPHMQGTDQRHPPPASTLNAHGVAGVPDQPYMCSRC